MMNSRYGHTVADTASNAPRRSLQDDRVDTRADAHADQQWAQAFRRHIGAYLGLNVKESRAHFHLRPSTHFQGSVRSGSVGSLRYLRTSVSPAFSEHETDPTERKGHCLLLVVAGRPTFETRHRSVATRPGDFVLLNGVNLVRISTDTATETIALRDPISRPLLRGLANGELLHRPGGSDAASMLSRWVQDVCTDRQWRIPTVAESISQTLRHLSQDVLLDCQHPLPTRLDRQAIEQQVLSRLEDDTLSLDAIAQAFGCSVRTLHRVFKREGDESLERYIQRQRVEACAASLRDPAVGAHLSLTDLALQFCFSSSSHFSTAFRAHFGMSPSDYRQSLLQATSVS